MAMMTISPTSGWSRGTPPNWTASATTAAAAIALPMTTASRPS